MHCWATDVDDPTVQPRWGKIGKQKIVDEGPLAPVPEHGRQAELAAGRKAKYNMETFDEVLVKRTKGFMDKAKKQGKPFFIWHNTTRMHVFTFVPPKYQAMMNYTSNYGLEEAGMAQMDDCVGALLKHLDDIGEADNTIVIFTTDNGAEVFTWPDGGMTPFKATKGTVFEGGFRVPCIIRWPGHIKPGTVENGIFSGLDWFPTLLAAAGNPNITDQLLRASNSATAATKITSTATISWICCSARGLEAPRAVVFRRAATRRAAYRRFQVPVLPTTQRLARRQSHHRYAHHLQHPPRSLRADPVDPRREPQQPGRWIHERLLRPRVLAVRARAEAGCRAGPDCGRVPAHASRRPPSTWMP